ncbi:DUF4192 domain-containing protein [Pseudonocardia sp. DLS-67]
MTPPADHPPAAFPVDHRPALRVRDQGELVAAVPAMLGFHPRESLVLMATGGQSGRRLGLTLRVDLPPPEHPQYAEHAELIVASAVSGLLLDEPAGAIAVLVSDSGDPPGPPRHSLLASHVESALEARHVPIQALMWAACTAGGARWACYQPCGCAGTVPDPSTTPFLAAMVAEGRVVHADRAALEALIAPADPAVIRRREKRLIRSADAALEGDPGGVVLEPGAGLSVVDAAITDAAAGRLALSDDGVVALATALGIAEVRAWALERSAGQDGAAAEHLWAALVREMPDPEAAEPAALLAVSALLRGDGALANIALDRAERAWPGHAFAGLVRRCAAAGIRPSRIRETLLGARDAR